MAESLKDTVYTLIGKHSSLDENGNPILDNLYDEEKDKFVYAENMPNAYAIKKINHKNQTFYFVKRNTLDGRIFNPVDPNAVFTHNKRASTTGQDSPQRRRAPQESAGHCHDHRRG